MSSRRRGLRVISPENFSVTKLGAPSSGFQLQSTKWWKLECAIARPATLVRPSGRARR
jgi:hypothetical protein